MKATRLFILLVVLLCVCAACGDDGGGDGNESSNGDGGEVADTCGDTEVDRNHCGECDNACAADEFCWEGECDDTGAQVLEAVNEVRTSGADCGEHGEFAATDEVTLDHDLNEAAQVHADDMAENDFIGHDGTDESNFSQRVQRTDYEHFPLGENVAAGYAQPDATVTGWVDSDGHCANLMNPDAEHMGAAVSLNPKGQYGHYWVQVFGRR